MKGITTEDEETNRWYTVKSVGGDLCVFLETQGNQEKECENQSNRE
jgi:hypothetical protein